MKLNKERTHDVYYDVKMVSASSLAWFEKSPLYFKQMLEQEMAEQSTDFFTYGDIVHKYILEKDVWKILVSDIANKPKTAQQKKFCEKLAHLKKGNKDEKLIKAYKESYVVKDNVDDKDVLKKAKELEETFKDHINYMRKEHVYDIFVSKEEMEHLKDIEQKIRLHKLAGKLLYNDDMFVDNDKMFIQNEFEIHWKYPDNGLECKSKIDRLIIDHENKVVKIVDLKTTSHLYDFNEGAFFDYKYYRQLAFYTLAVAWYMSEELKLDLNDYNMEHYIVAIGKKEPIEIRVFRIGEQALSMGLDEIEELMPKIEWHMKNDLWEYDQDYYENDGYILIG